MFLEQIASRRLELAANSLTPKKAKIKNLETHDHIEVSFNPEKIEYDACAKFPVIPDAGLKIGGHRMTYAGTLASTLKMDLLFDTTMTGKSVYKKYIKFLLDLLVPKQKGQQQPHPPLCQFVWGEFTTGRNSFDAVLEYLSVDYEWFLPDGTPVRASVKAHFKEWFEGEEGQNPTSRSEARSIWRVVEGQTLDWIAYQEYGESSAWRHIALANNLQNPRDLRPGTVLKLPPLP